MQFVHSISVVYSFYGGVICTPPPTLPSCPGLGLAQVPFFGSCSKVWHGCWGAHESEILIQISALTGAMS